MAVCVHGKLIVGLRLCCAGHSWQHGAALWGALCPETSVCVAQLVAPYVHAAITVRVVAEAWSRERLCLYFDLAAHSAVQQQVLLSNPQPASCAMQSTESVLCAAMGVVVVRRNQYVEHKIVSTAGCRAQSAH